MLSLPDFSMQKIAIFEMQSEKRNRYLIFSVAVLLGLAVRLPFVLNTDFPLNDGGLFYTMVRELQANHFRLPLFTSYNGTNIPFAYPPLAFYLAGILQSLTQWDLLSIFRFLPFFINLLCIPAFYSLALAFFPKGARCRVGCDFFRASSKEYAIPDYGRRPNPIAWLFLRAFCDSPYLLFVQMPKPASFPICDGIWRPYCAFASGDGILCGLHDCNFFSFLYPKFEGSKKGCNAWTRCGNSGIPMVGDDFVLPWDKTFFICRRSRLVRSGWDI